MSTGISWLLSLLISLLLASSTSLSDDLQKSKIAFVTCLRSSSIAEDANLCVGVVKYAAGPGRSLSWKGKDCKINYFRFSRSVNLCLQVQVLNCVLFISFAFKSIREGFNKKNKKKWIYPYLGLTNPPTPPNMDPHHCHPLHYGRTSVTLLKYDYIGLKIVALGLNFSPFCCRYKNKINLTLPITLG